MYSGSWTTRAQFPVGIYDLNTDALFHYDTLDHNHTSLVLTANSNFLLDYMPMAMSCLTWSKFTGKWELKDSLLILTESLSTQPEGLFVKMNTPTLRNQIKLRIIDDNFNPLNNLQVTFSLDNCLDSLILQSDKTGFVVLDLKNIKSRLKCSTDILKSGQLSIYYFDSKVKETKHMKIHFYSPSDIEVVLITKTQKKQLTRKIIYKIISDKLVFLGAYFNSPLFTLDDSEKFKGEFKYRNPK